MNSSTAEDGGDKLLVYHNIWSMEKITMVTWNNTIKMCGQKVTWGDLFTETEIETLR